MRGKRRDSDDTAERLARIDKLVHKIEDELSASREEGRLVSKTLADDSAARAKRAASAGRASAKARARAVELSAASALRVQRRKKT